MMRRITANHKITSVAWPGHIEKFNWILNKIFDFSPKPAILAKTKSEKRNVARSGNDDSVLLDRMLAVLLR